MSVKHHEEVSFYIRESEWLKHSLLECSNALHEAIGLLRQYSSNNNGRNNSRNSSCDSGSINNNCANGAINTSNSHPSFSNSSSCKSLQSTSAPPKYVLESKLEDELEAHSTMTSGGEDMFPKNLIAAVAKYNVENIANYCKSSVRVPSADEQLSFLSKVRNDESAKPSVLDSSGLLDQPVHPGILQMQNPMHGMNYFTHSSMPPMNSNCVYNPYLGGVPCNMNNPHLMYGTAHSHGMTSSMGLYGTENMSSQIPLSHSPLTTSNGGASDAPTGTMRLIESLMHKAWSAPDSPNSHPKNSGCSETGWKRNSYIHEEEGKCSFNDEYQRKKIKTELGSGNNRVNINQQNPSNACKHVPGEHLILNTSMAAVSTTDIPMCPIHKSVPNEFSRLLHRDADGHFTLMPPKSVLNSASELKS